MEEPLQDMDAQRQVHWLADLVRKRREAKERPFVLLLGAGASVPSGCSTNWEIVRGIVSEHYGGKEAEGWSDQQTYRRFEGLIKGLGQTNRYTILSRFLGGRRPSLGYRRLAELCKEGYFQIILTTNFESLLERALREAGLEWENFAVLVYKIERHEEVKRLCKVLEGRGAIVVLKLHGDYRFEHFLYTVTETWEFESPVQELLEDLLNRDMVVVGHSLREEDLRRLIHPDGGEIWYVSPSETLNESVWQIKQLRGVHFKVISGEMGDFDQFFARLYDELIPPPQRVEWRPAKFFYDLGNVCYEHAMTFAEQARREQLLLEAVANYQQAIERGFRTGAVYFWLARTYDALSRFSEAIERYAEAMQLESRYVEDSLWHRGEAYRELGQLERAMEEYSSLLDITPAHIEARQRLREMRQELARNHVREHGRITTGEYQELFRVSRQRAQKELANLVGIGLLARKGKGRSSCYVLSG